MRCCIAGGAKDIPPWLDEGLACCCSCWEPGADRATDLAAAIARVRPDRGNHLLGHLDAAIGTERFMALPQLLAASNGEFHSIKGQECQDYCESWAWCDFLLSSPVGRKQIAVILDTLRGGQDVLPAWTASTLAVQAGAGESFMGTRLLPQGAGRLGGRSAVAGDEPGMRADPPPGGERMRG